MQHPQNNNPLHGITLERILRELVEKYGRDRLYGYVNLKCFSNNPTIKSSLKFLRNVEFEWARKKVEHLYIDYKTK